MVTAIIVAAGKSERMGTGTDKAFLNLGPRPVVAWSLLAFERCADVDKIVLVVRKDQVNASKSLARMFGISKMLDENRYCGDVLTQIAAVESALQSVGYIVLASHMNSCVKEDIIAGKDGVIDETVELIKKLK